MTALTDLPDDVLRHVLSLLDLKDFLNLQRVNRTHHDRIESLGFPLYLSLHRVPHINLHPSPKSWKPYDLIRYNHYIKTSLDRRKWHAIQIGPTWRQPVIPTLLLTSSQLLLGLGGNLLSHPLHIPPEPGGKIVGRGIEYPIAKRGTGSGTDIIGIVPLSDDEIGIAQFDGTLQKYRIGPGGHIKSLAHYRHSTSKGLNVHTLSGSEDGKIMMTTTAQGVVSVFQVKSPWIPPTTFNLPTSNRAWSSLVNVNHPSLPPSLFVGVHGGILIYPFPQSGMDPTDSPQPERMLTGPEIPSRSSPYDMNFPPSNSIHNPSILLSAWYDSHLRLHDLRTSSSSPIAEFSDPWQWADGSAFYCSTFLGENYIAGGGARHGTVALFDIRYPKSGWSIFTPGGKGSPVYALQGDGGRLWGVTERRAWVIAFDGSGDKVDGIVSRDARAPKVGHRETPSGWRPRGGKWGWTYRYNEVGEICAGYDHSQRGVSLFDSLVAA